MAILLLSSAAWRRPLARHARLLSVAGTPGRPEGVSAAASVSSRSEAKPGLFQLPDLHTPSDFPRLTQDVKLQCHQLRQELAASPPGLQTLRTLDDVSNAICSVIDAAELCRNVHPNENFRRAASECFTELSDFIQNLNADVELYRALKTVTEDKIGIKGFTPEQRRMGILLRNEFERDGIHLSRSDRQRVISLQNDITHLSMKFQSTMYSAREYVEVPAKLIRGMPHSITSVCERKWMSRDTLRVPTDMHVMNTILKWVGAPEVRRKMYIAANSCAKDNLPVLDELRAKRHELAQLLGFPTYAHLATSDRMIGSPEAVENFIEDIAKQLMAKAKMEQKLLLNAKRKHEGHSVDQVYMWDLPYYMGMLKAQEHRIDSRVISAYFPLENCLKGLHLLCSRLFGLELKQEPMLNASERWHEDVVKLALTRNGETLGYIYFDLYPRQDKYNHAAHFTIRCGKRLSDSSYQKPIVALVCNFNKPAPDSPSLLTHAEVETLFHEFGHAMHSLLSRTEFQHLSGTRATLDFVETPSHLFEYFAWDYRVVSEFAHHYRTGAPLPASMMQGLRASKTMFAAMDTQTQCLYSMLDLQLFGEQPLPCSPSTTTQMLHELQNSSTLVPHVDGTYWHTRFGHLIGYGAGYYSYLYARVFAADIWHTNFVGHEGPLNREAGEKLYQNLMVHGGAKDPNALLVDMLGREPSPANYLHELGV
ncbi:Mitochondrial intermediate peptidase [Phytophthora fragariae]|uniref:Mitochondrial intermediate peptidase n=1 Tax=Phytophthora fragariae TaxID=53985 RepID=A0A6G0NKQ6_9STRA|nr:Mitochondrial intermediate peptidase [Phytophthora fragariae]